MTAIRNADGSVPSDVHLSVDGRLVEYRGALHELQRKSYYVIRPSSEAQRAWELIDRDIGELMRLRSGRSHPWAEDRHLGELLAADPTKNLRSTPALELHDQLRTICLDHSIGADLMALVAGEVAAHFDPTALAASGSPLDRLTKLSDQLAEGADAAREKEAQALVRILWRDDALRRSDDRMLRMTRSDYLDQLSIIMIPLVFLVVMMVALAIRSPNNEILAFLLTISAGAVGSILGGVLRFRDLSNLTVIRDRAIGTLAQPLIGGVAALFIFLVLESRLVVFPGINPNTSPNWDALGVYGFIAGFSEPFFLGILRQIATSP